MKTPAAVAHELNMAPTTLMNRLSGFTCTKSTELNRIVTAFGLSSPEELLKRYPKIRVKEAVQTNLSQRQIATALGISFPLLNSRLQGHSQTPERDIDRMADAFGFSSRKELLERYPKIRVNLGGKISRTDVATKLGVRTPTVQTWFSGKASVPKEHLDALITALGLSSLEELLEKNPMISVKGARDRDNAQTAREWAEKLGGVKPEYMRQILCGYHPLTIEISEKLCAVLNYTEEELYVKYPKLRKLPSKSKKQDNLLSYARQYAEAVGMREKNLYTRLRGQTQMTLEEATKLAAVSGLENVNALTAKLPLIRIREGYNRGPSRLRVPFKNEDTTQVLTISVTAQTKTVEMSQRQTEMLVTHLKAVREMTGITFDLMIKLTP